MHYILKDANFLLARACAEMEFIQETLKIIHSEHPFRLILNDILTKFLHVWKYVLFKVDNQPIAVSNIVISLLLFSFGFRYAKLFSGFVRNKLFVSNKLDQHAACSIERISYYLFILVMGFFVLEICNIPLATLTVIGTTLALSIGLGSQNIINNFISGLIIMIEKPIKLGDTIEVKNVIGKVIHIGARCVSLCTEDNINLLIPNSNILQQNIINWTLNDTILKMSLPIYIQSNSAIAKTDELLSNILKNNNFILKNPSPRILLSEITETFFVFEMEFWINLNNEFDRKQVVDSLHRTLNSTFSAQNIKISSKAESLYTVKK